MKSNYRLNYIELPLKVFFNRFPDLAELLPPVFDVNDDEYIVRMKDGRIEIGYKGDEWITK